jgi:hypothetical protein
MIDRLVLYLLLAGSVLFGALLYLELGTGTAGGKPTIEISRPEKARVAARPQQRLRHEQLVATILARPLFNPTRRPPETVSGPDAGPDLADARLTGIVTLPPLKIAIFAVKGAKPLVLGEGETVSGWRIERITPAEIALSGPGGSQTLRPKEDPTLVRTPSPGLAAANRPMPFNGRPAPGVPFRPPGVGPRFLPRPSSGAAPVWRP